MKNIKVGDKVRIRKDLVPDTKYGETYFVEGMRGYLGKVATITEIKGEGLFFIDNRGWEWTSLMFEPVTKTLDDLEVGDVLFNDSYVDEYDRVVEAICGNLVASRRLPTSSAGIIIEWHLLESLKEGGWKLKEELEPKVKKAIKLLEEKGYKVTQ